MATTFDFTKYLSFLETKGKELYHPTFKVSPDDYEIIFKLLIWFLKDTANAEKYDISFRKGILLSGPVGCGKTSLFNLIRLSLPQDQRYVVKSCREISFEFI